MTADWQWENAVAGSVAGLATVTFSHPLDVVRTRFQVYDGRNPNLPNYKNTPHALFTIARSEGLRGLYAGFLPAVLGSSISWGLYFYFYNSAKQRYMKNQDESSARIHLASAAEAGGLVSFVAFISCYSLYYILSYVVIIAKLLLFQVCLLTNPVWVVKTRLQLQNPQHHGRPYSGLSDAFKTILKDEGWRALYKGLSPGLFLVAHGAIQFTAYEELRKIIVDFRHKQNSSSDSSSDLLTTGDYAALGASSKLAAILATYPFQVIRSRVQQRPSIDGVPRYIDSRHAMEKTARGYKRFLQRHYSQPSEKSSCGFNNFHCV
ncbi:folate transporter 1, chloroplastic-like isoform X2 [Bidens hawaiensis]|uniref:folate transporter 1, chloroplastic-like isoform X2 n=1 Tax=Bidens hawaiensis TaxID=980011 RepID=UPI00404ABC4C